MKASRVIATVGCLVVAIGLWLATPPATVTASPKALPTAQAPACDAPASWFPHSQTKEADFNANFDSLCAFYQWSYQEFLWLTQDVGGGRLRFMDFPTDYDVFNLKAGAASLAAAEIPKNRPLLLKPRVAKSSGPTIAGSIAQAAGGVMVAPDGRAVYYETFVNDAFYQFVRSNQYYVPQTYENAPKNTNFPVGALELKSSWRVVLPGEDTTGYYTTPALIQPLTTSTGGTVIVDVNATPVSATVALAGLHVVGVVNGHPEFVWATFENMKNAPNLPSGMQPSDPTPVSSQAFTFYNANTIASDCNLPNQSVLTLNPATQTLLPTTNAFRQFAQGGGSQNNIDTINSLNASVQKQIGNDPFASYQLIGAIWLNNPPLGGTSTTPGQVAQGQAGSLNLANSTMETFFQKPFGTVPSNCFICHNTSGQTSNGVTVPSTNMDLSHLMQQVFLNNSLPAQAKAAKAAAARAAAK